MTEDKNQNNQENEVNGELAALKTKCEEYLNGWKRAQADYQNLKKETLTKGQELTEFIQAGLIMEILPIINHYKIALSHLPAEVKGEKWAEGFSHIYQQFSELLRKLGIQWIKTVGEKFDPQFHEAVGQEKNSESADHEITKEISPGYLLNDKVIKPAKVIVNIIK